MIAMYFPSLHLPHSLDTHYVLLSLITSAQQHQCYKSYVRNNTVPASLSLQKQAGSVPTEN